jgi:hypothetical protein
MFKAIKLNFSQIYNSKALFKAIDNVGMRWASDLMAVARVYPPPKPSGYYVRTYTLHDKWTYGRGKSTSNSLLWFTGVTAVDPKGFRYAQRVIGPHQMADYANTGWRKLHDVALTTQSKFTKDMQVVFNKWAGV